jgi:dipeptidyl aminopeptidase/acylaminoacyl peptidase
VPGKALPGKRGGGRYTFSMTRIVLLAAWVAIALCESLRGDLSYRPVAPGIERTERSVPREQGRPAATLWIYRPAANIPDHSLPAVFIAPAGSNGITGMALSPEDEPEHLPYVKQGFVVVAYDIDGAIERGVDEANFVDAVRATVATDGGLQVDDAAVDTALKEEPAIDPARLYAAGHSSAGTIALRAAAQVDSIRAVAAYAPVTDFSARLNADLLEALEASVPGVKVLVNQRSPVAQATMLRKPVFLFHAADDQTVPLQDTRAYTAALKKAGNPPLLHESPTGGHYDAMLLKGLEAGATWLADRAKRDATTQPTK